MVYLLNLVSGIGTPVDNSKDVLVVRGADVALEPVAVDISLNLPGKLKFAILSLEVDKVGLRSFDGTGGTLEGVSLGTVVLLSGSAVGRNRELKNRYGTLESIDRVDHITPG